MKRQIHAVKGHAEIAVAGHDVKLGRGGIREIEFFVQTQQLIFGGRRKQLRGSRTLDMLRQLEADQWITPQAADELSEAYDFLRDVEHRCKCSTISRRSACRADDEALKAFALFCGFGGVAGFSAALTKRLRAVRKTLRPAVRGRAGAGFARRQSGVHRLRRRSRDLEHAARNGVSRSGAGGRDRARLAFWPRAAVRSARAREVLTELIARVAQRLRQIGRRRLRDRRHGSGHGENAGGV